MTVDLSIPGTSFGLYMRTGSSPATQTAASSRRTHGADDVRLARRSDAK